MTEGEVQAHGREEGVGGGKPPDTVVTSFSLKTFLRFKPKPSKEKLCVTGDFWSKTNSKPNERVATQ